MLSCTPPKQYSSAYVLYLLVMTRSADHFSPHDVLPVESPPALLCQETFASRNKLPPIASQLLQHTAGSLGLFRLQAKCDTFPDAGFDVREPSRAQ